MALVTPDFSEVAEDIEPGQYNVRIVKGEIGESKAGAKLIKWTYETFGDEDPKNEGRKIFDQTMIEGKGAFMVKRLWTAATGGEPMPANGFDTEQLLGKEMQVVVIKNDRGYTEVKSLRSMQ